MAILETIGAEIESESTGGSVAVPLAADWTNASVRALDVVSFGEGHSILLSMGSRL